MQQLAGGHLPRCTVKGADYPTANDQTRLQMRAREVALHPSCAGLQPGEVTGGGMPQPLNVPHLAGRLGGPLCHQAVNGHAAGAPELGRVAPAQSLAAELPGSQAGTRPWLQV